MPLDKDGKVTGVLGHIRAALMTTDKKTMTGAGPRRDKKLKDSEEKAVNNK